MKTPNCISHRRFRLTAVPLRFVASLCAGLCLLAGTVLGGDETGAKKAPIKTAARSEEHTSELQSRLHLVCRLLLEKKKKKKKPKKHKTQQQDTRTMKCTTHL